MDSILCRCGSSGFALGGHGFRCIGCGRTHFWHDHVSFAYNTNGHEVDVRFRALRFMDRERADSAPNAGGSSGSEDQKRDPG